MRNNKLGIGLSIAAILGALTFLLGFLVNKSHKKEYITLK